jgi:hypothetical protein
MAAMDASRPRVGLKAGCIIVPSTRLVWPFLFLGKTKRASLFSNQRECRVSTSLVLTQRKTDGHFMSPEHPSVGYKEGVCMHMRGGGGDAIESIRTRRYLTAIPKSLVWGAL